MGTRQGCLLPTLIQQRTEGPNRGGKGKKEWKGKGESGEGERRQTGKEKGVQRT